MGPDNSMGPDVSVTRTIGHRVQKLTTEECKKRCSPRLRDIPASKRPYYGPSRNQQQPTDDTRIKKDSPTTCVSALVAEPQKLLDICSGSDGGVGGGSDGECGVNGGSDGGVSVGGGSDGAVGSGSGSGSDSGCGGVSSYVAHSRIDISRVKDTLRIYNKYYFHFSKVIDYPLNTYITIL